MSGIGIKYIIWTNVDISFSYMCNNMNTKIYGLEIQRESYIRYMSPNLLLMRKITTCLGI